MAYCRFCHGKGCIACPPDDPLNDALLFQADADNPRDWALLIKYFGKDAVDRAFGPNGGGIAEIRENALEARACQAVDELNSFLARMGK